MAFVLALATTLTGCERGLHEMYDQPKYLPLTPSSLFPDGNSSRPQVAGTLPYSTGSAALSSSGRLGRLGAPAATGPTVVIGVHGLDLLTAQPASAAGHASPRPATAAQLLRGRERFDIYCAPCHGRSGDGQGMIVRRGFPAPPSYHSDRLRAAPDSHFYEVITRGYGAMYPYADRIDPTDRWAITAYIRALQLSQHAPATALSSADLQRLAASSP